MDTNPFKDNDFFVYQTTVELEDGIILVVITDGPGKSKYRTVNLSTDFERVYELANPVHMKLTMQAMSYTESYS